MAVSFPNFCLPLSLPDNGFSVLGCPRVTTNASEPSVSESSELSSDGLSKHMSWISNERQWISLFAVPVAVFVFGFNTNFGKGGWRRPGPILQGNGIRDSTRIVTVIEVAVALISIFVNRSIARDIIITRDIDQRSVGRVYICA